MLNDTIASTNDSQIIVEYLQSLTGDEVDNAALQYSDDNDVTYCYFHLKKS